MMMMMMMRFQSRALENSKERKARRADLYLLPSVFQVDHFLVRERHPSSSSSSSFFFVSSESSSLRVFCLFELSTSRVVESFKRELKKFFSLSFFDMIFRQKTKK